MQKTCGAASSSASTKTPEVILPNTKVFDISGEGEEEMSIIHPDDGRSTDELDEDGEDNAPDFMWKPDELPDPKVDKKAARPDIPRIPIGGDRQALQDRARRDEKRVDPDERGRSVNSRGRSQSPNAARPSSQSGGRKFPRVALTYWRCQARRM